MGERLQLMDMSSYEMYELEYPEEYKGQIEQGMELEIQDVMGKKMIMRVKG